ELREPTHPRNTPPLNPHRTAPPSERSAPPGAHTPSTPRGGRTHAPTPHHAPQGDPTTTHPPRHTRPNYRIMGQLDTTHHLHRVRPPNPPPARSNRRCQKPTDNPPPASKPHPSTPSTKPSAS